MSNLFDQIAKSSRMIIVLGFSARLVMAAQGPSSHNEFLKHYPVQRVLSISVSYEGQTRTPHLNSVNATWQPGIPPGMYSSQYEAQYLTKNGHWIDGKVMVYGSTDEPSTSGKTIFSIYFLTEEDGSEYRIKESGSGKILIDQHYPKVGGTPNVKVEIEMNGAPNLLFNLGSPVNGKSIFWSNDEELWHVLPTGASGSSIDAGNIWLQSPGNTIFCEIQWFQGLICFRKEYVVYPDHHIVEKKALPRYILRKDVADNISNKNKTNLYLKSHPEQGLRD